MPNSSDINEATAALIARALSGEAGAEECARLEELAVSDPAVAAAYADAEAADRELKHALGGAPEAPGEVPPVPAGLLREIGSAAGSAPSAMGDEAAAPESPANVVKFPNWATGWSGLAAAAATVVLLGVGTFLILTRDPGTGTGTVTGTGTGTETGTGTGTGTGTETGTGTGTGTGTDGGGPGSRRLPPVPPPKKPNGWWLIVASGEAILRRDGQEFRAGTAAELSDGDEVVIPGDGQATMFDGDHPLVAMTGPGRQLFPFKPPGGIKSYDDALQMALSAPAGTLTDAVPLMATRSLGSRVRSPIKYTRTLTPVIDWRASSGKAWDVEIEDLDDPDRPPVAEFKRVAPPVSWASGARSLKPQTDYRLRIRDTKTGNAAAVSDFTTAPEDRVRAWPSEAAPPGARIALAVEFLQEPGLVKPWSDALMLLEGLPDNLRETPPVLRMIALCAGRLELQEAYDAAIKQIQGARE